MTQHIKAASRGSKPRVLADYLEQLIDQKTWAPGAKLPSMRKLAREYGVSLETAHKAVYELQERGRIRINARSGSVVAGKVQAERTSRYIAYVRLLGQTISTTGGRSRTDEIPTRLEQALLEENLQLVLVSERPETQERGKRLAERLQRLGSSLAGVVLLRPPADVRDAVTPMLDQLDIPWLMIGRFNCDNTPNIVAPNYVMMGQLIGRYLALMQVKHVLFLTERLSLPTHYSGVEKMQGLVGGYLQQEMPTPLITPLLYEDSNKQTIHGTVSDYLQQGHRPGAIVGYGDTMTLPAIRACRDFGLRVPEDMLVIGTTGRPQSAELEFPLTVGDQQFHLLTQTLAERLLWMIATGQRRCEPTMTPVRLVFRKSTMLPDDVRLALAADFESGRASIEH